MVTVAELADKYMRRKMSNKEFSRQLNVLHRKQTNDRHVRIVVKALKREALLTKGGKEE